MTHDEKLKRITVLWWLFNTRWVTVSTIIFFLALTKFVRKIELPYPGLLSVGLPLFFFGSTAIALWWLRPKNRARIRAKQIEFITNSIIPIDLVLISLVYFAAGGIGGWGRFLFFYIPIMAIVLYENARSVLLWGSATVLTMLVLTYLDIQDLFLATDTLMRQTLLSNDNAFWLEMGGFFAVLTGIVGVATLGARGFHESEQIAHREFTLFTKALEDLPDAVVLWSRERGVTFVNKRSEELFRIKREDVLDRPIKQLITPETARLRSALMFDVPDEDTVARFSLPDGDKQRIFIVSGVPLSLKKGYGSELRLFRETTHEEEVSKLKSKFMSVAAHQLRTPISGLKWVIQMIISGEAGPITDMQREFLGRAAQTAERMIRLIGDLLDVSRIEEGRFAYDFQVEPNIVGVIEEIVGQFRERAKEKGIELKLNRPEEPLPPLLVDSSRLNIAIENIVSNSFKYTQTGGITTTISRDRDNVLIKIQDTGVGIPKDEMPKLFAKFYRGRNVMEQGIEGTGLGLFITKSILKRHGGDISVTSEEGKGTTFIIKLPVDPTRVPSGEVPIEEAVA